MSFIMGALSAALSCGLFLFLTRARRALACTTVLVGREASETGEVLVGHNEDSGGRYVMRTHLVPALSRGEGETCRFEPDLALLPLPRERARLFWSEARPFIADGGASFCDLYVNGNGVALVSDNCTDSREDRPELTDGGIGYGLRRLVAEGARSACHAVELAADYLDRFGYASSGRAYHFADCREIWVMQIVRGRHYAVKRVPDDEVYLNPNHYTIRQPDPGTPGYEELVSYAIERGWYNPEEGPFDFARAYQDPGSWRSPRNVHRHVRGLEIILDQNLESLLTGGELPFSVRPPRKIGAETVKRVLRTHFEGTPSDVARGETPHFMETRPVCAATTLESTVITLREDVRRTVIRRAPGRPCSSPYVPWYFGISQVPEGYGASDPEEALATHFRVPASDLDCSGDAWFCMTALQAAADPLYQEKGHEVHKGIQKIEKQLEQEFRLLDTQIEALIGRDPERVQEMMDGAVAAWTGAAQKGVENLRQALGVFDGIALGEYSGAEPRPSFVVRWSEFPKGMTLKDLDMSQCLCGPHYLPASRWSKATYCAKRDRGFTVTFCGGDWVNKAAPCLMDLTVVLRGTAGQKIVGRAKVRVREGQAFGGKGGREACDCA